MATMEKVAKRVLGPGNKSKKLIFCKIEGKAAKLLIDQLLPVIIIYL
jgi:hypothetical protein